MGVSVRSFVSSILKFSVSSWINFGIGILAVVIMTRCFSPEVYGALNLFNTASMLLVELSCLGVDGGFIRFYYEPPEGWDARQLFAHCLLVAVAALAVISCVGAVFFWQDVSMRLFAQLDFTLTALLVVNALSLLVLNNFFSQYYRIGNDPYHYTIQQVLVNFFSKLFVVSAALISPTLPVVLFMNTIGLFLLMVVYIGIQHRSVFPEHFSWDWKGFGEVFRFGVFSWPTGLVWKLNMFLIPFFITTQLGAHALGVYASAGFIVAAFNVVQGGFRTYWSAFMYGHYRDSQEMIPQVHNFVGLGIVLLLASFLLFQHAIYLLIGADFQGSRLFFALVLIDPLLSLYEQTTEYGTSLAKKNEQLTMIYVGTIALNFVGTWVCLGMFGILGAAVSSAAMATVRFALATWRGQRYYRSIEAAPKTFSAVALILVLAASNVFFVDAYALECLTVALVLAAAAVIYRADLRRAWTFARQRG